MAGAESRARSRHDVRAADFEFYYPSEVPHATFQDGQLFPIPRDQWRTLPMDDQFDAVLYLGSPAP